MAGRRNNSGFSLIELVIVVSVLFLVMGSIAVVSNANTKAYQTGATSAELESRVTIAMDRIVAELRVAGLDKLDPDPVPTLGATTLRYVRAEGFTAGEIDWSPLRQLELELEPGELDDGLDNNGNGLIDEGRLVLTQDLGGPEERRLVIVRWVAGLKEGELDNGLDDDGNGLIDEPGFVIQRFDESLVIQLSLQKLDAQGFPIYRTGQTSTRVRN